MLKKLILNLYFLFRLPLIVALKLLCPARRKTGGALSKILILRLDRLGDLVLSLPFIEGLRAAHPSAKIDILVRPYLAALAGMIEGIDGVILYHGMADAFRNLPGRGYDVAVDMLVGYSLEPAAAALATRSGVRIGFRGGFREVLFTSSVDAGASSGKGMVELGLELLKPLGAGITTTVPRLFKGKRELAEGVGIVIHPGGHYASQRWAPENFAKAARSLAERYGARVTVVGGPGDRGSVAAIMGSMGPLAARAEFPDLKGLAGILRSASIVICNNSGPLHLAAALGVPTVSVMGPTDPVLWRPRGEHQEVVRGLVKCSPCQRGECADHRCLKMITPDEVVARAAKILKEVYGIDK
jgi:ADP-heptose:LPS heptosyltransferase